MILSGQITDLVTNSGNQHLSQSALPICLFFLISSSFEPVITFLRTKTDLEYSLVCSTGQSGLKLFPICVPRTHRLYCTLAKISDQSWLV